MSQVHEAVHMMRARCRRRCTSAACTAPPTLGGWCRAWPVPSALAPPCSAHHCAYDPAVAEQRCPLKPCLIGVFLDMGTERISKEVVRALILSCGIRPLLSRCCFNFRKTMPPPRLCRLCSPAPMPVSAEPPAAAWPSAKPPGASALQLDECSKGHRLFESRLQVCSQAVQCSSHKSWI